MNIVAVNSSGVYLARPSFHRESQAKSYCRTVLTCVCPTSLTPG